MTWSAQGDAGFSGCAELTGRLGDEKHDRQGRNYARGMSTREIQWRLEEFYKVDVSQALISDETAEVQEEVLAWQNRAPDARYPLFTWTLFTWTRCR